MSQLKPITCRAAVMYETGKPLVIEDVLIEAPSENQVRLKMVSAGLCASDAHHVWGEQPMPPSMLPMVMGHEGAGIVESVGANVTSIKTGDYVLTTFMPRCNDCDSCSNTRVNLCGKENGMLIMSKSNKKLSDGTGLFGYCGLGTYSEYLLVKVSQVVKVDQRVNMENACIISCGVGCGFYSATNQVVSGTTAAIYGLGTVGLNAAYGCKYNGVKKIIGIDINNDKKEVALAFGCTDFINPSELDKSVDEYLLEKYGGVDYAFECIGKQDVLNSALKSLAPFGTLIFIGVAPNGTEIVFPAGQLLLGRKIIGTLYGNKRSDEGCQELVKMYIEGKYDIDRLVTNKFKLQQINEAFQTLHEGKCIKSIIVL